MPLLQHRKRGSRNGVTKGTNSQKLRGGATLRFCKSRCNFCVSSNHPFPAMTINLAPLPPATSTRSGVSPWHRCEGRSRARTHALRLWRRLAADPSHNRLQCKTPPPKNPCPKAVLAKVIEWTATPTVGRQWERKVKTTQQEHPEREARKRTALRAEHCSRNVAPQPRMIHAAIPVLEQPTRPG